MKKCNRLVTQVFLYLLPFAILIILSENWGVLSRILELKAMNWLFAAILVTWILSGVWFFILLIFNNQSREVVLAKLANIQERDEREEQIVGKASKQTFLFILAVLLVLFALSTIRYGEGLQNPQDKKFQSISIGHWGLFETHADVTTQFDGTRTEQVRLYELIPISKTGLLLFLIVLTLLAYHFSARRSIGDKKAYSMVALFVGAIILIAVTVKPQYVSWSEFPSLLAKAEKGDVESQNRVGEMYLFGQGIKQDFESARAWFLKASDLGNAIAANHLGRLYLNGEGVQKNIQEACKWYRLSAVRGDHAGQENAKWCESEDAKKQKQ